MGVSIRPSAEQVQTLAASLIDAISHSCKRLEVEGVIASRYADSASRIALVAVPKRSFRSYGHFHATEVSELDRTLEDLIRYHPRIRRSPMGLWTENLKEFMWCSVPVTLTIVDQLKPLSEAIQEGDIASTQQAEG